MTRLLAPELFGLMSIASIVMVGLTLLTDIGIRQNIIQHRHDNDQEFFDAAWTLQIFRGFAIWLTSCLLSVILSALNEANVFSEDSIYSDDRLPIIISIISLSAVIEGFSPIKFSLSIRKLDQTRITFIEISAQLLGVLAMLIWIYFDRSIWAMVMGWLYGVAAKIILSYILIPGRNNRIVWNLRAFKTIIKFGKWIFLTSLIGFMLTSGDRLILGIKTSPETMGFYSIAFLMVNTIYMMTSKLSSSIIFPALSDVFRRRPEDLSKTLYNFKIWIDSGMLFTSGFLFSTGGLIVDLLYDDRYAQAGGILQILALTLVANRYAIADQCYLSMGKPHVMTYLIAMRTMVFYILVPFGLYTYGLNGALWCIVLSGIVTIPASLLAQHKFGILNISRELVVLPIFLVGVTLGHFMAR